MAVIPVEAIMGRNERNGRRKREPDTASRTLLALQDCAWRAETVLRGRTKPEMTKKSVTDARPLTKARIMGSWMKWVFGLLVGGVP